MTAKQNSPLDWIKQIPEPLADLDKLGLINAVPEFPWGPFTAELKTLFQFKELSFTSSLPEWRSPDSILTGLEGELISQHFAISPLEGSGYWVMPKDDVATLISLLFRRDLNYVAIMDQGVRSAFQDFLFLEVMRVIEKIKYASPLFPKMIADGQFPNDPSFCIDITFTLDDHLMKGRLVIPQGLYQSINTHYLSAPHLKNAIADQLEVFVSLEGGQTTSTKTEWEKIAKGDFLFLDTCSVDPDLSKGKVLLTVQGVALYRGMIKKGNLKILENPLYFEAGNSMHEDDESEYEESQYDDESLFDEDSDYEEESEYEEDYEEEVSDEEHEELEEERDEVEEEPEATQHVPAPAEKIVEASDIPFVINVELTRIRMTVRQLSELTPGNLLELNVKPEDGVNLVVNGKKIAHGELIKVGDVLGVRILEIG